MYNNKILISEKTLFLSDLFKLFIDVFSTLFTDLLPRSSPKSCWKMQSWNPTLRPLRGVVVTRWSNVEATMIRDDPGTPEWMV